jgi:hypothetical protein
MGQHRGTRNQAIAHSFLQSLDRRELKADVAYSGQLSQLTEQPRRK